MSDVGPSEFGGDGGVIQPLPHVLTTSERLLLMKRTGQDPDAITDQRENPEDSRMFREGGDYSQET